MNRNKSDDRQEPDAKDLRDFSELDGIIYLNYEDQANEIPDRPINPNHRFEVGKASYYSNKLRGRRTASGEIYDPNKLTAAHPTLPFGTMVRVTNLYNRLSVIVKINDRGPRVKSRIIDLSYVAAKKIGIIDQGIGEVAVEVVKSR